MHAGSLLSEPRIRIGEDSDVRVLEGCLQGHSIHTGTCETNPTHVEGHPLAFAYKVTPGILARESLNVFSLRQMLDQAAILH